MRYLILSYRANGADYCRGCLMDQSDSKFDILETQDQTEAAKFLAHLLFLEKTEESGLQYCSRETYIYVNGLSKDSYVENEEFEESPETIAKSHIYQIESRAQEMFDAQIAAHQKAEAAAEEQRKKLALERQKQVDLATIETLKKKHGID